MYNLLRCFISLGTKRKTPNFCPPTQTCNKQYSTTMLSSKYN